MGLRDDDLADPTNVSDTFRCPVCMDVFEDPVFCGGWPCQHIFCRECVEHALEQNEQCPSCRAEMHQEDLQPHQALNSLLDELLVRCSRGCPWTGRRDAKAAHDENCPMVQLVAAQANLKQKEALIVELKDDLERTREVLMSLESEQQFAERIAEREAKLKALSARAAEQDADSEDLRKRLQERDAKVLALESRLAERDAWLVDKCQRLSAHAAMHSRATDSASLMQRVTPSAPESARNAGYRSQPSLEDLIAGDDLDI